MKNKAVFALMALLAAVIMLPRVALAHAVLTNSKPAAHQVVPSPDVPINLHYNSRIDAPRSTVTLMLPDGTQRILEHLPTDAPDTILATAKGLHPGTYTLHWQVLARDGHITRGDIPFSVK